MTEKQFEDRRRSVLATYAMQARIEAAAHEMAKDAMDGIGFIAGKEKSRQKSAAAKRRLDLCTALRAKWDSEGFWTRENTLAFEMIYKNSDDIDSVSAF